MFKQPLIALAMTAMLAPLAHAKVIQDDSRRVLTINQVYDESGNSRLKNSSGATVQGVVNVGEFRWSSSRGFDMQGLFTAYEDGLIYPGESVGILPLLPRIDGSGTPDKGALDDRMRQWTRDHGNDFGRKDAGAASARKLGSWLAANAVPMAIVSFSQDVRISSAFGESTAKVVFDKTILPRLDPNAPDRMVYGEPKLKTELRTTVRALYYPLDQDEGTGVSGNTYGTQGGRFRYIVKDMVTGDVLIDQTVDTGGAFDSSAYPSQDVAMNCIYDVRNPGCRPASIDLRRIMSYYLADYALLEYYRTPELKTEDNADPTSTDQTVPGRLTITKREMEYQGCAVRYINEGTYTYTTVQQGELWAYRWGGEKQLVRQGAYESERTDNYRKEMTYYITETMASDAPPLPFNREKAAQVLLTGDQFISPSFKRGNELIRAADYKGNLDPLPAITTVGDSSANRYVRSSGLSRVEAICTPQGDVRFFFGRTPGQHALLQYKAWDFTSPSTQTTANFKDLSCAEGQAQINGNLIYFTSAPWANVDSSIGDSKGNSCGTVFVNGTGITAPFDGQKYCPAGFQPDSCDPSMCSYKGVCSATTGGTTNTLNGTCDAPMNTYRMISIDESSPVTNGPAVLPSPAPKFGGTARCGATGTGTGGNTTAPGVPGTGLGNTLPGFQLPTNGLLNNVLPL